MMEIETLVKRVEKGLAVINDLIDKGIVDREKSKVKIELFESYLDSIPLSESVRCAGQVTDKVGDEYDRDINSLFTMIVLGDNGVYGNE